MNWYKRHLGDYAKDTPHLSMIEHGAYTLLLDFYYSAETGLPADMQSLYRLCRAMNKAEQAAVKSVVDAFFPIGPDGQRHNKRADKEIAKLRARGDLSREFGMLGGRPKQSQPETSKVLNQETLKVTETETSQVIPSETLGVYISKAIPDTRYQKPEKYLPPTPLADAKGAGEKPPQASEKRRRRAPLTEAPAEFALLDGDYDWANGIGLDDATVTHETARFLNHAKAQDRRCADWRAAWRNWMLKAVELLGRKPGKAA